MTITGQDRGAYWDSYYSGKTVPDIPSQFASFVLSEFRDAGYVIDVGCGNGRDSLFFANHGMPVVSIDASATAIDAIARRSDEAGLSLRAITSACDAPDLLGKVDAEMQELGLSGPGVLYARFFIHAITEEEQAGFLDFCAAYLARHGGHLAFEFRTAADAPLAKVTAAHYRRYVETVDFLQALFERGMTARYLTEGTGYAKYKSDDAHVVRMIVGAL